MRKNLLAIGLLAIGFSTSAQILTHVGNEALVTVTDGALVYNGGGWQNAGTGKVANTGDVMIVGASGDGFIVDEANGAEFRLKFNGNKVTYGQLYINGLEQGAITGKVHKEYIADDLHSNETGHQQLAVPFFNFTLGELNTVVGGHLNLTNASLTNSGRWAYHSVMKWNNAKSRFDHVVGSETTTIGVATDYIIVPHKKSDGTSSAWVPNSSLVTFPGVPYSDAGLDAVPVVVSEVASFGTGGNAVNYFREKYNTYLTDPFRTATNQLWTGDYGKNIMQFSNPFLTNLDLYNIEKLGLTNVEGLAYFGSGSLNYEQGVGTTYGNIASIVIATTTDGSFLQAGATEKFMIKPLGEVMIKFSDSPAGTSFNLSTARKFAQVPVHPTIADNPTGKIAAASIPADRLVKQVAVVALDGNNTELGRTYYAVSPSATTGMTSARNLQAQFSGSAIYSKEETEEGLVDASSTSQLYINEANEVSYKGKEISLVLNNDNIKAFKFLVYEGGRFTNKLNNGESFYLINGNTATQINHGDVINTSGKNYSVTYGRPNTSAVNPTAPGLAKKQTVIAKKDAEWVVRFADNWKSADIEVYSAAGRLVHSAKAVSTISDYVIPVDSKIKGMFVVKATSDSGEVITQKIVK